MFTFATRVTSPGRSFFAARKTVSRITASSSVEGGGGGGGVVVVGEGDLVEVFVGEGLATAPPSRSTLGDFFTRGDTLATGDERRADGAVGSSRLSTTRVPTIS